MVYKKVARIYYHLWFHSLILYMLPDKDKHSASTQQVTTPSTQKLQKMLALQGLGSRREIEQWIQAGRCMVNGKVATLGIRVSAQDTITVDGRFIALTHTKETHTTKLLLYYKRDGEICSTQDPQGRSTVFDCLPPIQPERWIMVGRLDYNTQGLLLFTTDGLLSHRLLHPSYEIEREYAVRVHGIVTPSMLHALQEGVLLDGQPACFSSITTLPQTNGSNNWYRVILKEGRQREVRRLWATQGVTVSRLIRIRFGPIKLPTTLNPGQMIWLSSEAVHSLKGCVGL